MPKEVPKILEQFENEVLLFGNTRMSAPEVASRSWILLRDEQGRLMNIQTLWV